MLLHHYESEEIGPLPVVDEAKGEANSTSEIINDFNFPTRRITMMNMAITVIAMRERKNDLDDPPVAMMPRLKTAKTARMIFTPKSSAQQHIVPP